MDVRKFTIHLVGMKPGLLMNNPKSMFADKNGTDDGEKKGKKKESTLERKVIPTPEEESAAKCYRGTDGSLVFPSVAIRSAMMAASRGYKIKKKSAYMILAAALFIGDEYFTIKRNGKPVKDYEIDIRRAVVQRVSGVLRARPLIPSPWEIDATFEYDAELIPEVTIREFAILAGQIIGIGDYRPQKSGWFGKFEVK